MRYFAIFLLGTLLLSCGSAGNQRDNSGRPPSTGSGDFTLRFNPVRSLADRPELSLELAFDSGWERIAVVDRDPQRPVVSSLLRTMGSAPEKTVTVSGELTRRTVSWGQGHASRILKVKTITASTAGSPDR